MDEIVQQELSYSIGQIKKSTPYLDELKLTPRMRKFCWYYVYNGFNGYRAALSAGYSNKRKTSVAAQATENLKKPSIRESIGRICADMLKEHKGTLESELFKFYYNRAFYDPGMFVNADGTPAFKDIEEIPKEWKICIDGIEGRRYGKDGEYRITYIKLADRDRSAEKLEKYIQMIKETITIQHEMITPEAQQEIEEICNEVIDDSGIIPFMNQQVG